MSLHTEIDSLIQLHIQVSTGIIYQTTAESSAAFQPWLEKNIHPLIMNKWSINQLNYQKPFSVGGTCAPGKNSVQNVYDVLLFWKICLHLFTPSQVQTTFSHLKHLIIDKCKKDGSWFVIGFGSWYYTMWRTTDLAKYSQTTKTGSKSLNHTVVAPKNQMSNKIMIEIVKVVSSLLWFWVFGHAKVFHLSKSANYPQFRWENTRLL